MRKQITITDIGCGFGGLLAALAHQFPNDIILSLEIRTQVLDFVHDGIPALRIQHLPRSSISPENSAPASNFPPYSNISALRANTIDFFPTSFLALNRSTYLSASPINTSRFGRGRLVLLARRYAWSMPS
jgi:tRNA (guanine-N7-)-methyltransferase